MVSASTLVPVLATWNDRREGPEVEVYYIRVVYQDLCRRELGRSWAFSRSRATQASIDAWAPVARCHELTGQRCLR